MVGPLVDVSARMLDTSRKNAGMIVDLRSCVDGETASVNPVARSQVPKTAARAPPQ